MVLLRLLLLALPPAAGPTAPAGRREAGAAAASASPAPPLRPTLRQSLDWWDARLAQQPSAEGSRERCMLVGMANDVRGELECWEAALAEHGDAVDGAHTRSSMAFLRRRLGEHRKAADELEQALAHEPRRPDLLLQLGLTLHISGGQLGPARRRYRDALAMAAQPEEAPALLLALASVELQLGEVGAAAAAYHTATGDAIEPSALVWGGAGSPGFAGSVALLGGQLPEPAAAAYPSPTDLLEISQAESGGALSSAQWAWLHSLRATAVSAWDARQQPADCAATPVLIVELRNMTHGLGSQIHLLSLAASYAEEEDRALLFPDEDEWWFTDATDCEARAWGCHMKTVSSCSASVEDLGEGYDAASAVRLGSSAQPRTLKA